MENDVVAAAKAGAHGVVVGVGELLLLRPTLIRRCQKFCVAGRESPVCYLPIHSTIATAVRRSNKDTYEAAAVLAATSKSRDLL